MKGELVWLQRDGSTPGRWVALVHRGAFYSKVIWSEDGIEYEDTVENDDYEFLEDRAVNFEPDDE